MEERVSMLKLKVRMKKVLCSILAVLLMIIAPAVYVRAQADSRKDEFHAVWISYLEFLERLKDPVTGKPGFTQQRFEDMIDEMFDKVAGMKMNAVIVHVRPFGDAMYPSEYFPWSRYISGAQGKNPGFDPLEYMVTAAHDRGLEFHAWINPYRVTSDTTDVSTLSKDNAAREWLTNESKKDDRNVLSFGGALYYNPSSNSVQTQIRYGIQEIVKNYDVDGIHFDDYFYPSLGSDYKKNFDAREYDTWCKENEAEAKSIANWRRDNVNRLIRNVYQDIKEINPAVEFGISPGGFLDSLQRDDEHYTDIRTWLSEPGYVDYLCPQLYWSFSSKAYPYDKTLDRWLALRTNEEVKMYVGIAAYRAGSSADAEWKKDSKILRNMVEYGRKTGEVSGFMYFRYDYFYKKETGKAIAQLLKTIK
jgi:uncharacterized lipoprotein YddW (UPF0748 family)